MIRCAAPGCSSEPPTDRVGHGLAKAVDARRLEPRGVELDEHAFERAADPELPKQRVAPHGWRFWATMWAGCLGTALLVVLGTFFLARQTVAARPYDPPVSRVAPPTGHALIEVWPRSAPKAPPPPAVVDPAWGDPDERCRRARIDQQNQRVLRRAGLRRVRVQRLPVECSPPSDSRAAPADRASDRPR